MTINRSAALITAQAATLLAQIGNAAILRIYTGVPPLGGPDASPTGVLLCALTGASPFGTAGSNGLIGNAAGIGLAISQASGPPGYLRIVNSTTNLAVMDLDISSTGNAAVTVNVAQIAFESPVQILAFNLPGN